MHTDIVNTFSLNNLNKAKRLSLQKFYILLKRFLLEVFYQNSLSGKDVISNKWWLATYAVAAPALKIPKEVGGILKYFPSLKVFPINFTSFFSLATFANVWDLGVKYPSPPVVLPLLKRYNVKLRFK